MTALTSVNDIDLRPLPGKTYFNFDREWREEFIYFLLVDRFHDGQKRQPKLGPGRSRGIQAPDNAFYGGNIKGITQNLDYIAGLGCTAIWLSPIFENNAGGYHGYNIKNYLAIDPHFGTKQDLIDLVQAAHSYKLNGSAHPLRVILDIVLNHSGDNWFYPGNVPYNYCDDQQFPLGGWREDNYPVPVELRKSELYHRRGNMVNYDAYPEKQHGDMCGLKDYASDDDAEGSELVNILIKAHCYWIREADVDGFRVDAIKHMGELACSRFSSNVREYAYSLGKRGFFLFGELAAPEDSIAEGYLGPNTSRQDNKTVFFGIDSVLDFPLAEGRWGDSTHRPLRDVLKGITGPETLFKRWEAQHYRALNRGELGRYLVTFIDNHDTFWQPGRFAKGANDKQVIGAIGFLLCALGTPCIYYGTEQGFEGAGGDNDVREAMFDKATAGINLLNTGCTIYKEISKIASVMRSQEPLRFGRMYYRDISGNGTDFGPAYGKDYTLAFSRLLYGSEVLVAYNVSSQPRSDCVIVDSTLHRPGDKMRILYPIPGMVTVEGNADGKRFVRLNLAGNDFAILR